VSKGSGQRIKIGYVKRSGKAASFWADAPLSWQGQPPSEAWAKSVAEKRHPGATDVEIIGKGTK
jgi:hypothetical protein